MYGQQFATDEPPEESIPEESQSPGGYPPSSGLPPDAMMMLSGMQPGMMGGMQGGMQQGQMQQDPNAARMAPDMGMGSGMGAQMAGMQQQDPMMAIRQQFDQVIIPLQMLAQAFPMAVPALQEAGEAVARAMLMVAQGAQPDPTAPPVPA